MVTLTRDRNWTRIYTTAKEEWSINNSLENINYYEWFLNYTPPPNQPDMMTEEQTKHYFTDWCTEQHVNPDKLLQDLHDVLIMKHSKKNTLYLQGASNAGKMFLLKGIVPVDSKAGYHTTSKDFPFREAVNAPIILINELTIESPAKSELYKNIFGGEPTQVNIKNRPSQLMGRKPVLLTSNDPIWKEVAAQKPAILNRLLPYLNLQTSDITRNYSKFCKPNPSSSSECLKPLTDGNNNCHQKNPESNGCDWSTDDAISFIDESQIHQAIKRKRQHNQTLANTKTTQMHIPVYANVETQYETNPVPVKDLVKTPPVSPIPDVPLPEVTNIEPKGEIPQHLPELSQTDLQELDTPEYKDCPGCQIQHPSQTQHMMPGRCCYQPPDTQQEEEPEKPPTKKPKD